MTTTRNRPTETDDQRAGPFRHRGRAILLAGILTAIAAGAILVPTAAHSAPSTSAVSSASAADTGQGAQEISRGFDFINLSSQDLTFASSTGPGDAGLPAVGSVLKPGASQHAELVWWFGSDGNWKSLYWKGESGAWAVKLQFGLMALGDPKWNQIWSDSSLVVKLQGTRALILDAAPTHRDLPAAEKQAQAETLRRLCLTSSQATCTFTPTKRENVVGEERMVGSPTFYRSGGSFNVSVSDTVGQSDSVGVELTVGGKLFTIVEAALTARYEHTWTIEHTFAQDIGTTVGANTWVWVVDRPPLIRDTGDFTITMGNASWTLHDVYFDSPDPTPPTKDPKYGFFVETRTDDGTQTTVQRF